MLSLFLFHPNQLSWKVASFIDKVTKVSAPDEIDTKYQMKKQNFLTSLTERLQYFSRSCLSHSVIM